MVKRIKRWEMERSREEGLGEETRRKLKETKLIDKKKKEERRRKIVIRGVNIGGKGIEEKIKKLWRKIEVEEIKRVRKIGKERNRGGGIVLPRLESLEAKKKRCKRRRN